MISRSSPILHRSVGALAVACVSGILLSACAVAPGDSDAAEEAYLFGFSRDQILAVKDPVAHPYSEERWLDINRGAFECARFGDLCRVTGPTAAHDIIKASYDQRLAGASIAEIDASLAKAIDAAAAVWVEPEGEGDYRDSLTGYQDNGSDDTRVRIRAYMIYPIGGTAYSKGDCTVQEKGFLGIWGNVSGTHTAKIRSHVSQYTSSGVNTVSQNIDYEPNPADHGESLITTDTGEVVEVGRLYHTASYDWGLHSGNGWETYATIIPRACCSSSHGSWTSGGSWCVGGG